MTQGTYVPGPAPATTAHAFPADAILCYLISDILDTQMLLVRNSGKNEQKGDGDTVHMTLVRLCTMLR